MSYQTQYEDIKQQAVDNLASITLNPKPSYSIDGQKVDHADYLTRLQRLIDWCDEKLTQITPIEITTRAGHP